MFLRSKDGGAFFFCDNGISGVNSSYTERQLLIEIAVKHNRMPLREPLIVEVSVADKQSKTAYNRALRPPHRRAVEHFNNVNRNMNTIIIEDENLTAQRLAGMLKKYDLNIEILATLPSVADSVEWLRKNGAPDLVFMDIHLEDDLCFKIFELVPLRSPVIFTTAYDEYMIKAFKVNSIDYLLKPVNLIELIAALDKYKALKEQFAKPDFDTLLQYIGQRMPEYKTRFMITVGNKIRGIETTDTAYFYSDEKITFLVTRDGQHLPIDFSLDKLATLLDPRQFFRINRQYLVGFSAIQTVWTHYKGKLKLELTPKARHDVFVSGDRMTDFKDWMGR